MDALASLGLEVLCPIVRFAKEADPAAGPVARVLALLGLGPRADGRPYGREEMAFLKSVAACAATPIENGLIHHELEALNQSLSVKVYQLHNLFDLTRELTSSFDEEGINLVRIESRPSREKPWDYVFFAELDGHPDDEMVAHALDDLGHCTSSVRVLGAWPLEA